MLHKSSKFLLDISREYSIYVCENRAIPKVADGLKDSQRKAIWAIRNKSEKIKTVSLGASLLSDYGYLHGDQAASSAISMLAAPYVNNVPLIEGLGAFGTRVSPVDGIGSPRYTNVKRGKALESFMLYDLDILPMKEIYDGSAMEPVHFLPLIPTVLLNGVSGIAVGWSTDILRRKFEDLVDACIDVLNGKKVKKLIPYYHLYDIDVKHLMDNSWEFSGKAKKVDSSTIRVTELPPDLSLEKFKERLNTFEDEGKINSYSDASAKTIDITIKMQRGTIANWSDDKIRDFLKLTQKKTERIVVVDWNSSSIKQYESAEDVVTSFVDWRLKWYKTRYEKKFADDSYELDYWLAVKECFDKKLPEKLQKFVSKKDVAEEVKKITKKMDINEVQVDKIISLPSYRWTKDSYNDVLKNIADLQQNLTDYETLIKDPELRKAVYLEELKSLKKFKY